MANSYLCNKETAMRYCSFLIFFLSYQFCHAQADSFSVGHSFTDADRIYFSLPDSEHVLIRIYDKSGVNVETVLDDSVLAPGPHTLLIHGSGFLPGKYLGGFVFGSQYITQQIEKENYPSEPGSVSYKRPIRLSPNPTHDVLNIPISGFKNIYILTLSGQLARYLASDATSISLAGLPVGNYAIRVAAGDGKTLLSDYVMVMK
jgi:hypothetical protein